MKPLYCLFLSLIPSLGLAQFNDDFSDGDFTTNPAWVGDTDKFIVNGAFELQSNSTPQSDTAYLSTEFSPDFSDTIQWTFRWRMAFSPSDNNRAHIYLTSTLSNTTGPTQGYFLRIGESGSSDALKLYRANGSSNTLIATGGVNTFGANPDISVMVMRYPSGDWEVFADPAGGTAFVLEASASDANITQCSYFGVWCKHTSSNASNFYFDDFVVDATLFADTEAPEILNVSAVNTNEVQVTFNEPLDSNTADVLTNYSIDNGIGQPTSVTRPLQNNTQVLLEFSGGFSQGTLYTLTVNNVEDLAGNAITNAQEAFTYFLLGLAGPRDVVINELMADTSPAVSLPAVEFVELYNTSDNYFQLQGWQLSDASSTGLLAPFVLEPDGFVIACASSDTAIMSAYGDVVAVDGFPTLNNSADIITLQRVDNLLIDRVAYSDSWYQDSEKKSGGYTLEQINPNHPCSGQSNWSGSKDNTGGTPGSVNSIYNAAPDTIKPQVLSIDVSSITTLTLNFSEVLDSLSTIQGDFDFGTLIENSRSLSASKDAVSFSFQNPIDSSTQYSVSINGPQDCFGNTVTNAMATFGLGRVAKPFDLVINELSPNPDQGITGLPEAEFVELYNRSGDLISTEDLQLADRSSSSFLARTVIFPEEYIIVCDDGLADLLSSYGRVVAVSSMPSLNNSDDRIALLRGTTSIDEVNYDDSWYGDDIKSDGGYTLERIDPADVCGRRENWGACEAEFGGTPGGANSIQGVSASADQASVIGAGLISEKELGLFFDKNLDAASVLLSAIEITPDLNITAVAYDQSMAQITLTLDTLPSRGTLHTLRLSSLRDCAGKALFNDEVEFYYPKRTDLVINELLSNPRGSGSDFVEIHNTSPYDINLNNYALGYLDNDDSLILKPLAAVALTIEALGFVAFNEDNQNILDNYPNSVSDNLVETDLPSYSNDEGSVRFYDPTGVLLEQLDYRKNMHYDLLKDLDGVSLERVDPGRSASERTNWTSASYVENYATPGYENSQLQTTTPDEAQFSIEPEVFSPDQDGFQDLLTIEYNLPRAGYTAGIRIYNADGYLVRDLVSNALLGTAGAFSWDGTNNAGERARIGIHVVIVELFDLFGNVETYKLSCVVASRL